MWLALPLRSLNIIEAYFGKISKEQHICIFTNYFALANYIELLRKIAFPSCLIWSPVVSFQVILTLDLCAGNELCHNTADTFCDPYDKQHIDGYVTHSSSRK